MNHLAPVIVLVAAGMLAACGDQAPAVSAQEANTVADAGTDYAPKPYSTLAQIMRGMNYPNSENIFGAQSQDPAAEANSGPQIGPQADLYGGWEKVEYAALMLSEAANLILIPGRVCENGLPVPLENADFRMYAQTLVEAGQEAYEAAKMRDMDAMVEVSSAVSEACLQCHETYRDKPEGEMRCVASAP